MPEGPTWQPAGVDTSIEPPPPRFHEGKRWRPAQGLEGMPQEKHERSKRAVAEQCMNARVPGYTGFIPSARAEDVCARTQAAVGRHSHAEQMRRREINANSIQVKWDPVAMGEKAEKQKTLNFEGTVIPDDHPLGKSRSNITRNHWVPTIPGYGGFIPSKDAESCIGGGMTATCRQAGRVIMERQPKPAPASMITANDDVDRGRMVDYYQQLNHDESGITPERERLVGHLRDHCGGKIPGYMGFIPRVHGESIFGAGPTHINKMAADYNEDRVYNPSDHGKKCCAPQVPDKRKLRM